MGNKADKPSIKLSQVLEDKVIELFNSIDTDSSGSIEKKEAKEYWKKNLSQVNTIALFDQVDVDHDGHIELPEWIQYWTDVFMQGKHSEEQLIGELQSIIDGNAWKGLKEESKEKKKN